MIRLRLVFAWLLMAALPVQGFAAASMLMCDMGATHGHMQATNAMAAESALAPHAATPHDHAAHGHSGEELQDQSTKAASADGVSNAAHTCSICAACCNSVAIVGLEYVIALAPAPQPELAEPFVRIHTRPSPVPDKPPRA